MQVDALLGELKHRLAFGVAVGYGLMTFALLQVAEPIMHALHLPDVVLSWLVLALAAAFPVSITVAGLLDHHRAPETARADRPAAHATGRRRPGGHLVTIAVTSTLVAAAIEDA